MIINKNLGIDNEMKAHSWLKCGEYYITGDTIREEYSVVGDDSYI